MLNRVGFNSAQQTQKNSVSFGISIPKFNKLVKEKGLSIVTTPVEGGLFGTLGKIAQNSEINYAGLNPIKIGKTVEHSTPVIAQGKSFGQLTQRMANLINKGDNLYELGRQDTKFLAEV